MGKKPKTRMTVDLWNYICSRFIAIEIMSLFIGGIIIEFIPFHMSFNIRFIVTFAAGGLIFIIVYCVPYKLRPFGKHHCVRCGKFGWKLHQGRNYYNLELYYCDAHVPRFLDNC